MHTKSEHRISIPRKLKTKSGCSTCKKRKVKCDEGRPSCHRCVSTGRTCDGYGIFGGGGKTNGSQSSNSINRSENLWLYLPALNHGETTEEKSCFEWFQCRTAPKLPGIFESSFWNQVVFQACSDEPAVLHAILALSCFHKIDVVDAERRVNEPRIPDEQEQFALQQYGTAIGHLQSRLTSGDKSSIQVALVTCVIFVCLEYLRGHYKTAGAHLKNGLKLLKETQPQYSIDPCINEAFTRLHVHVALLNQHHQDFCLDPRGRQREVPISFESITEARQHLDQLLNEVSWLTEEEYEREMPGIASDPIRPLSTQRKCLSDLSSWLEAYVASKPILIAQTPVWLSVKNAFAYELLKLYHSMAIIMAQTCERMSNECAFDSHTHNFLCMLVKLVELRKIVSSTAAVIYNADPELRHSIADIGWIPLLYYVAIKCRNHRIRLQAIRLLESTSHREGIWSARMVACISKKVMETEEQGFYQHLASEEGFELFSLPQDRDFAYPPLPNPYRFDKVQVTLPNTPADGIILYCRRARDDGKCETFFSEFCPMARRWIDGTGDQGNE